MKNLFKFLFFFFEVKFISSILTFIEPDNHKRKSTLHQYTFTNRKNIAIIHKINLDIRNRN
jgi:hypothetical protein